MASIFSIKTYLNDSDEHCLDVLDPDTRDTISHLEAPGPTWRITSVTVLAPDGENARMMVQMKNICTNKVRTFVSLISETGWMLTSEEVKLG